MKAFAKVLIRVFSMWVLFQTITMGYTVVYMVLLRKKYEISISEQIVPALAIFSVMLFVGIMLWVMANKLAHLMLGNLTGDAFKLQVTYKELMMIVFKMFGLILIATSIQPVVEIIISYPTAAELSSLGEVGRKGFYFTLIFPLIKIAAGFVMMFVKFNFKDVVAQNDYKVEEQVEVLEVIEVTEEQKDQE